MLDFSELLFRMMVVILTIVYITIFPFIIFERTTNFIVRCIAIGLAKLFQPEICKPLLFRSAHMAAMGVYTPNPGLSLVCFSINTNTFIKEEAQFFFQSRMVDLYDERGKIRYEELRQYIFNWMWFPFWRWDKNFNIKNHVSVMTPETFSKNDLADLRIKLMSKAYAPKRSPWEIIIINNYVDEEYPVGPKHVMIFRFHHSLMDGFTVIKIFMDLFGTPESSRKLEEEFEAKNKQIETSWTSNISKLTWIFSIPYDLIYSTFDSFSLRPWQVDSSEYTKEYICASSGRIANNYIKSIKNGHSVSFTAVTLASLTAGVRKGLQINEKIRKIPAFMYLLVPFRMRGHPLYHNKSKLQNHFSMALIKLPVGEADSKKRLQLCEKYYKAARRSLFPVGLFFTWYIMGSHFTWVNKPLTKLFSGGVTLSTVPGFEILLSHNTYQCLDITYFYTMIPGNMGVGFSSLTYLGGYRLNLNVDKAIFQNESDVQEILNAAVKELDILHEELQ